MFFMNFNFIPKVLYYFVDIISENKKVLFLCSGRAEEWD